MDHADQALLHEQGHPEQRLQALLAQDRVEDVGVVDVGDLDRPALGGDPAGEAAADGDPHALLDLLLKPLGRARGEHAAVLLEQQDRDGVDRQDRAHAIEQRVQQLVQWQRRECSVGDLLEVAQLGRAVSGHPGWPAYLRRVR